MFQPVSATDFAFFWCTTFHFRYVRRPIVIVPAVIDTLHRAQRFELTYHLIIIIRRNHDHSEQAARNGRSPTPLLLRHRRHIFIGSTLHRPIVPIVVVVVVVVIARITAISGNRDAVSPPPRHIHLLVGDETHQTDQ